MKPLLPVLFVLAFIPSAAWCALPNPLRAPGVLEPGETPPTPHNIRVEVQMVAIPEKLGFPLVAAMKEKDKIEAANDQIQKMLAKGTAKLLGWPIVTTRDGQQSAIHCIKQIRYASEYTPPTMDIAGNVPDDPTAKVDPTPTVNVTTFEGVPSAFGMQDIGVELEVMSVLNPDGKTIEVNITPRHVRLKGFNKVTLEGAAHKGKVVVEQPQFETNVISTSLEMKSGQRMLLGVYPTDDPPKHLEFFILKVEIVPVE